MTGYIAGIGMTGYIAGRSPASTQVKAETESGPKLAWRLYVCPFIRLSVFVRYRFLEDIVACNTKILLPLNILGG